MRHGARINVKFLKPDVIRKVQCKRCVVCEKALHAQNKIGLCSICYNKETNWNNRISRKFKQKRK